MAKITDYSAATEFPSDGVFLIDGTGGTKNMTLALAAELFPAGLNAYNRRNLYQEKSLGSSVTTAQQNAINAGTFDGLFVGNYWTISSVNYDIADMNYWYGTGSSYNFSTNHVVVVPRANLYTAQMNSSNTTEGGYTGSEMYTANLDSAKSTIQSAFGSCLLTHEEYLITAVTDGYPTAGAWFDSTVDIMNEEMVYGCPIRQQTPFGGTSVSNATIDKSQLALFRLNPRRVNIRSNYWLRDIYSAAYFACVGGSGSASGSYASYSFGVRPAFAIGKAA